MNCLERNLRIERVEGRGKLDEAVCAPGEQHKKIDTILCFHNFFIMMKRRFLNLWQVRGLC